jgi:hypothetical protein
LRPLTAGPRAKTAEAKPFTSQPNLAMPRASGWEAGYGFELAVVGVIHAKVAYKKPPTEVARLHLSKLRGKRATDRKDSCSFLQMQLGSAEYIVFDAFDLAQIHEHAAVYLDKPSGWKLFEQLFK